ncbi:hypothetical protein TWF569_008118 [Orbilia oligospora]|uniref:Uncharacterized protein n=1 Tax=Orbilia oligospora TaxID=2813651 RepID=A0A6G1M818_ORBOL|nr:hypothetical protein TWF102_003159 [Orbilia oligospora]KAF3081363.1 hypothetical protein TWF103_003746 [Orbilia oligospora]KAF3141237.1 hypothetical protein TWF569_008118 [Orbilia oligospora]KAF3163205.1 hypothetical protein TWF788_001650 [Orbilia oligospora]KAF3197386.1 hypothetical protein TWF191_005408 [Orbilia oligospora]
MGPILSEQKWIKRLETVDATRYERILPPCPVAGKCKQVQASFTHRREHHQMHKHSMAWHMYGAWSMKAGEFMSRCLVAAVATARSSIARRRGRTLGQYITI